MFNVQGSVVEFQCSVFEVQGSVLEIQCSGVSV